MSEHFYRAFEDKFRGSRELIKSRLLIYRPLVEALKKINSQPSAIDLGCGRGEWLELLSEWGVDARGVDLDQAMLSVSQSFGLNVTHADALSTLRGLPDNSQLLVSGFHIAEHLSFSILQDLVEQSLRVLKPGGVLILETPNPENFSVAAVNFYLDPTHQRPIPPKLLSFLPEYYGFLRVHVWRLQEQPALVGATHTTLRDVWEGVSPDYAVIAQKSSDANTLGHTDHFFSAHYGLSLDHLLDRFDEQFNQLVAAAHLDKQKNQVLTTTWWRSVGLSLVPFRWLIDCFNKVFKK
jgi:O-antigen chain-terminating methyltransferase